MNAAERAVRALDRTQQGFPPTAFVFGVMKKFGDDRAGSLAALIAYYGFLSLFPLLLLLVTVLGMVAGQSSSLAHSVEGSALSQFPVIGNKLGENIKVLHRNSSFALVFSMVVLLWGAQGASQAGQHAMAEVWNVPGVVRPNFWSRLGRTGELFAFLGVFLLLSTGLTAVVSFANGRSLLLRGGGIAASLLVNLLLYVVVFRILTPKQVATRQLVPGALLGGLAWTILQLAGTLLVDHQLRNTSQVYGFFAIVLGLLAFIYLGAEMTMYVAEANVVLARRLWPRSIVQPPLTDADRRVLVDIAHQGARRPELSVVVHDVPPETPASEPAGSEPAGSEPAASEPAESEQAESSAGVPGTTR